MQNLGKVAFVSAKCDIFLLHPQRFLLVSDCKEIVGYLIKLQELRKILRNSIKLILFSKRDLRQTYRNIIRFLFKNMDDQSGDNNVLYPTFIYKTFIYYLTGCRNEIARNYKTTSRLFRC